MISEKLHEQSKKVEKEDKDSKGRGQTNRETRTTERTA